jgi:hypothetical protein
LRRHSPFCGDQNSADIPLSAELIPLFGRKIPLFGRVVEFADKVYLFQQLASTSLSAGRAEKRCFAGIFP